jgi:hypothetical protein
MISVLRYTSDRDAKRALTAMVADGFVVCDHSSPQRGGGHALTVMHNSEELDDVIRAASPDSVESEDHVVRDVTPRAQTKRGWATTWVPAMPRRTDATPD